MVPQRGIVVLHIKPDAAKLKNQKPYGGGELVNYTTESYGRLQFVPFSRCDFCVEADHIWCGPNMVFKYVTEATGHTHRIAPNV